MPAPVRNEVTFEIDGREVTALEGDMLVDGAKHGDVEIPVFCYDRKLGKPVGACRMCLVEIEGIPKLQTACSTPVRDGMVVVTGSEAVRTAQNAVVEFLLINHPLDCPVCDKGGECPLQDVTYGWGPGRSRFIEPKRHFKKPLELSPLVAIDRERCILCYRCVRFSQELSEDYQLVLLERGDHTYVGTHDGAPYVAPFSGNIVGLCPVGALTSTAYRFRARPWDIEGAGTVCTLCPSQCNVELTIRDDTKVMRVLERDNEAVDDGWLCDRGRFGYQAIHAEERITAPMVRDGGSLREVSWERALEEAGAGLRKAGAKTAALAGGEVTNEEGYLLQLLMRDMLGSPHIDSRTSGRLDPEQARILARPDLSAAVGDIDWAGTVLVVDTELVDESPILDLRVRKAIRRNGTRLVVASSRPSSLDPNAHAIVRFAPGASEALLGALAVALGASAPGLGLGLDDVAARAGASADAVRAAAEMLGTGPVVVLWGERISSGGRGAQGVGALLAVARALGLSEQEGGGLLEVPAGTNARGLRETGCLPTLDSGLTEPKAQGLAASEMPGAMGDALSALILMQADPLRTHPDQEAWRTALDDANFVVAFADFPSGAVSDHADVVFPAESYAEKEGTVTHPDGRLQRLRQGVSHPGEVRSQCEVLMDLMAEVIGTRLDLLSVAMVFGQLTHAVPFYDGITLADIAGKGVRWQERDAASRLPAAELSGEVLPVPPEAVRGLRLATAPSLWASRETEHAPVLRFLAPLQRAELSPQDAGRLGVSAGDELEVSVDGSSVRATAALRQAVPTGTIVLTEGTREHNATVLMNDAPRAVEIRVVAEPTNGGPPEAAALSTVTDPA